MAWSAVQFLEECVQLHWPVCLNPHPEAFARVFRALERAADTAVQAVEELLELGLQTLPRCLSVRSEQAVIQDYFAIPRIEFQPALEFRLLLQPLAGRQSRTKTPQKIILRAALIPDFAVVQKTEPVERQIQAVIRFMAHQENAGPSRHMAIIGYVDQQLFAHAVLDPSVKNRDGAVQLNRWAFCKNFDVYVLH